MPNQAGRCGLGRGSTTRRKRALFWPNCLVHCDFMSSFLDKPHFYQQDVGLAPQIICFQQDAWFFWNLTNGKSLVIYKMLGSFVHYSIFSPFDVSFPDLLLVEVLWEPQSAARPKGRGSLAPEGSKGIERGSPRAIPYPCKGPRSKVLSTSMSSVPAPYKHIVCKGLLQCKLTTGRDEMRCPVAKSGKFAPTILGVLSVRWLVSVGVTEPRLRRLIGRLAPEQLFGRVWV